MAAANIEPQHASAIRLYEPRASGYDFTHHPSFTARFFSHLTPYLSPGQKILDLACGTGLLTFRLADAVGSSGRVVGVDVTPGMLAIAREKLEKEKRENVELFEHDVLDLQGVVGLKGMKGQYDGITGASMLVLFQDPVAAMKHWVEYLKPGGFVAIDVTHPQNLAFGSTVEKTARRLGAFTLYHRMWVKGPESLEEVMGKCGVKVEEMITVENQSGQGDRSFGVEEADTLFEDGIDKDICKGFRESEEVRAKAKEVFREEWKNAAVDGRVPEMDTVFLGIGRKIDSKGESISIETTPKTAFSGSCRCGSIAYTSATAPKEVYACYCAACRQLSGSGYIPWIGIPNSSLKVTSSTNSDSHSTLRSLNLTKVAERKFCDACGTPLIMSYHTDPRTIYVSMGTVDEGSLNGASLKVGGHIFLKEKAAWVVLPDDGAERWDDFPRKVVE